MWHAVLAVERRIFGALWSYGGRKRRVGRSADVWVCRHDCSSLRAIVYGANGGTEDLQCRKEEEQGRRPRLS
jgi:hypothetical protein